MSTEDIERAVLKLLTADVDDYDRYTSLTTLFEKLAEPRGQRDILFNEVDPYDDDKEALRTVVDQMVLDGLLEARMGDRDYERSYRITDQGTYEEALEEPAYVAELQASDAVSRSIADEPTLTYRPPRPMHSASWTGLTNVRIDARNATTISNLISSALSELPKDDNAKVAQARTLLLAAKDLADAPDPPSDLIWELIQRAGAVVGLLDVFLHIFLSLSS